MGMAIMTLRQEMVVTVNATIDYLSAAAAGSTLTTVGKVDRLGGKLAFCSAGNDRRDRQGHRPRPLRHVLHRQALPL